MSTDPFALGLRHELEALRGNWLWFVILGIALIVLGGAVLGYPLVGSLAVEMTIGILLIIAGVGEAVGSFWAHRWSGFFLHLLSGILSFVVGLLFVDKPLGGLAALTILVASFLLVGGIFKIAAALSHRFAHWGWPLLSGVIDVVLGLLIWRQYPESALWVIGLFLGINLIFRGVNWIGLGLALRSLAPPRRPA